jgi:Zn-dependent protease
MRNREFGSAVVGAAGPGANLVIAVIFGLLVRAQALWAPLLGAGGLPLIEIASIIALTNLVLAVFNLVPIPPLDGSKVLFALLPPGFESIRTFLESYGFFILLAFIFYFSSWIFPVVSGLFRLLTGMGL